MKKLGLKILIFTLLLQWVVLPVNQAFAIKNPASIYTDFAGTEFSQDNSVAAGTSLKIEITNDNAEAFEGNLIYCFYSGAKLQGIEFGKEISFVEETESISVSYSVKGKYENVSELKIMLWSKDGKITPLSANIIAQKATGPDGPSSQYRNFGEQPDDKLKEQMPVPFDIDNYELTPVSGYDFDDFDFSSYSQTGGNICGDFMQSYCKGIWSIVSTGGIGDSPCVKLENSENVSLSRFQLVMKDYSAVPGDWYCLKFKVRTESSASGGSVRPYLEFADDSGKTVSSEYGTGVDIRESNDGWVECNVINMIAQPSNDIEEQSSYYSIFLNAFMENMPAGSSAYIDDIKLYKVFFEPMETVLVTPNYKGLIYGDGGKQDINLKIYLNTYNGSYDLADFTLKSQISDASGNIYAKAETDRVTSVMDVSFSSDSLEMGEDYYLTTVLFQDAEEIQRQEWTLRKREAGYRPDIYIDEHNRYVKNGKAILPAFQYAWGGIYEEYVDVTKNTPIDAFTVAGEYHTGYRTPRMQRLRKSMDENGVGGLLETCGYVYSNLYTGLPMTVVKKQSDIRSLLTVMCSNFKDDPLLWGYRVFDEQSAVHYGEELRWQNDIMASVDIDHPTFGVTDKIIAGRPGIYSKTADIIGVDPYFCTGKDDQDLSKVGRMIRSFKKLNPGRPVFVTLQGFWFEARGDLRGPTEQEYRNMVWQAVCEGVTALDTYSYTDLKNNPWGNLSYEELWQQQVKVLDEIESFESVILSTLPAPYCEIDDDTDGITVKTARYNGKSYVFAVNVKNCGNTLKVKLDNVTEAKEYYTGNFLKTDSNGYFSIEMEPWGVAILEAEQPHYLSSEAELIRFGASSGESSFFIADSDKESPVILVGENVTEIDYCVTASDYASLYINGEAMEACGKLNIENLNTLEIKVISEDGRFSEEKTYTVFRNPKRMYMENFDSNFNSNYFKNSQVFEGGEYNGTYYASTDGYNGSKTALKIAANGTSASSHLATQYFPYYSFTESGSLILNVKMKINSDSLDGVKYMQSDIDSSNYQSWSLYGESDGKYHLKNWSDTNPSYGALSSGRWYDISIRLTGGYVYTGIYDAETGEKVISHYAQAAQSAANTVSKRFVLRLYNLTEDGIVFDCATIRHTESTDIIAGS